MSALFPPWTNDLVRALLAAGALGVVGVPVGLIVLMRTPHCSGAQQQLIQPVLFDHRHHVRDDGIDCLFCHGDAMRGPLAGVPSTAVCLGCHAQIWTESPLLAPVLESAASGRPIQWLRVWDVPDFAFFDHHAHTRRGVGCASCHGRVDLMAQVVATHAVSMEWCLGCHRDPAPHLRPLDRVTDMEWTVDPLVGAALARSRGIRPPTNCTGCHR